jgi:hypothetical protein
VEQPLGQVGAPFIAHAEAAAAEQPGADVLDPCKNRATCGNSGNGSIASTLKTYYADSLRRCGNVRVGGA